MEILQQRAIGREAFETVRAATIAWNKYHLDDVTVGIGSSSYGLIIWDVLKGRDKVFSSSNVGKFFPADETPNSFFILLDLLTIAAPAFKAAHLRGGFRAKVTEGAAERALSKDVGELLAKEAGKDQRRLRRVFGKKAETGSATLPPGEGFTDKFGNVTFSTQGSQADIALVRFHEQVHSALTEVFVPAQIPREHKYGRV